MDSIRGSDPITIPEHKIVHYREIFQMERSAEMPRIEDNDQGSVPQMVGSIEFSTD